MGNHSVGMAYAVLDLFNAYEELTMSIFKRRKTLFIHRSHRSIVAHYSKKEQLIITLFSFGITLALLPECDRKETEYNVILQSTKNGQIAVRVAKVDFF